MKKGISLDYELRHVKIVDSINRLETYHQSLTKQTKKDYKVIGGFIATSSGLFITHFLTGSIIPIIIFSASALGIGVIGIVKNNRESHPLPNINTSTPKTEEFHTQAYQEYLKRPQNLNYEKYQKAALRQHEIRNSKTRYTQEEIMQDLVYLLDGFYLIYKLPTLTIPNQEWDIFITLTYKYLTSKNNLEVVPDLFLAIEKYAIAQVLYYKSKSFSIGHFVDSLIYLANDNMSPEELTSLQKEIINRIQEAKVIQLPWQPKLSSKKSLH